MYCSKCGTQNDDAALFCSKCGVRLMGDATVQQEVKTDAAVPPVSAGQSATQMLDTKANKPKGKQKGCLIAAIGIVAVIVIIVIIVIASSSGNPSAVQSSNSNSSTTSESSMTPLDIYSKLQENDSLPYSMSQKSQTFINENPDYFPTGDINKVKSEVDYNIQTKFINKNPENYGDKLMYFPSLYVQQIFESNIDPTHYLTELNVADTNSDQYYIYYLGKLDKVFKGDQIQFYGLPLGTSSFDNTNGGQTLVIVFAGSLIDPLAQD